MDLFARVGRFVWREFLSVLPPTLFFLVAWSVVLLTTSLVLESFHVPPLEPLRVVILGGIVGKIVVVLDKAPFVRALDERPLAYPVVFRAAVFSVFVMLGRLAEAWLPGLFHSGSTAVATQEMLAELPARQIVAGHIWVFVLFLLYFAFAIIFRRLGLSKRQILTYFLVRRPPHGAFQT